MPVNLWDLVLERRKEKQSRRGVEGEEEGEDNQHSVVLVSGSKNCGKTSLLLRFLDRDEPPKPTAALEYTYGRRSKANSKQVVHLWELGGGSALLPLLHIAVQPAMLPVTSFLIMVDLGKPSALWNTIETNIRAIEEATSKAWEALNTVDPKRAASFKETAAHRYKECVDIEVMHPLLCPLAIVGARYDEYQDLDMQKRKMITQTMRFLAHYYGASLQYLSMNVETLVSRGRALVGHLSFGSAVGKTVAVDVQKPIFMPLAHDSFADIGSPPVDGPPVAATSPLELWRGSFEQMFPSQGGDKNALAEDPAKDHHYMEASIDKLRATKDEELLRYMRQVGASSSPRGEAG